MVYVEAMRVRPKTYRFELPEKIGLDDVIIMVSGLQSCLTPADYSVNEARGPMTEIVLNREVPAAGGIIKLYAFFQTSRPQSPRKKS